MAARGGRNPAGWKRVRRERVRALRDRLRDLYGVPVGVPHRKPVDELVRTILSQSTSDRNRDIAFGRLTERFGLADILDQPVQRMSLGQRMRCEIVASLLHAPNLLFLDEPTIGLDITAKAAIRDFIREQAEARGPRPAHPRQQAPRPRPQPRQHVGDRRAQGQRRRLQVVRDAGQVRRHRPGAVPPLG